MTQESSGIPCIDFVNIAIDRGRPSPEIRRFRELLTRILRSEAGGIGAADRDLREFNRLLSRAGERRGVVSTVRGYGWGWVADPGRLLAELFPVLWSAAALLTGEDRHRLKLCQGCGLLFLDQSRNRSRRWCDMGSCGNRAKQRRLRDRRGEIGLE